MKHLLSLLICLFFATRIFAQILCAPTFQYCNGKMGVYPIDSSIIPQPIAYACPGQMFNFILTVVAPDSIYQPLPLNLNQIQIENIGVYNGSGSSLSAIPYGLTYTCISPKGIGLNDVDSEDCIYMEKSCNCILISGIIPTLATPSDINLTILARINGALLLSFGDSIPGTLRTIKGKYIIRVKPTNECITSTSLITDGGLTIYSNFPNPVVGSTIIKVESIRDEEILLDIFNFLGEKVKTKKVNLAIGTNSIPLDCGDMKSGIYFYSISNSKSVYTSKMQVVH